MVFRYLVLTVFTLVTIFTTGCKHNLVVGDPDPDPVDTTVNPIDTTMTGIPCNADVVYFEKDILPVLRSNCAFSGCHDAITGADGIRLNDYTNVMKTGKVKAGKPFDSDLYEVITENKDKDRMPPPPAPRLSADQITLIQKWITQGAKNETCDDAAGQCSTDNISFGGYIKPLLTNNCLGCHNANSQGGGVRLDTYEGIRIASVSGRLYGSVARNAGFAAMPQGSPKLNNCHILKLKSWIDNGSLNN
ncbi:MAG: hypothetical protein IPM42_05315 [Saprospiraceae bacterium]|nr:hypothetical protein [Saprospiraceae bacterium]